MQTIAKILIILLSLFFGINSAYAESCIAASDFGLGGLVYVYANPDGDNSSSTKLVFSEPPGNQVATWIDSLFSTTGIPKNPDVAFDYLGQLKVYVEGSWQPWGNGAGTTPPTADCSLRACTKEDGACMPGGKVVTNSTYPCNLKEGWGLYGLIAIEQSGESSNPNDPQKARALSPQYFRTFDAHITGEDRGGKFFILDKTQICNDEGVCITDTVDGTPSGKEHIKRGKLYFKILDNHYGDNTGYYVLNVVSGITAGKGVIAKSIDAFQETLAKVTLGIYNKIVRDANFISIVRAMLILYIAIAGLMFAVGLIQIHQSQLVIHLFKIAIISTVISEDSWNFFNVYLFSFFSDSSQTISAMLMQSVSNSELYRNSPLQAIDTSSSPLIIFDTFLKIITSKAVNAKIISLLFYSWTFCWFIIFIYVAIFFLIVGIMKTVVIYLLAILQLSMLLVVAPIFLIMFLFKITKHLFDSWLKALVNSAFLMALSLATLALFVTILLYQIYDLLHYSICWQEVWKFEPPMAIAKTIHVYFWYPQSYDEVSKAITFSHYVAFLVTSLLFKIFMSEIPSIADGLSVSQLGGSKAVFAGATRAFGNLQQSIKDIPLYKDSATGKTKTVNDALVKARNKLNPLSVVGRGVDAIADKKVSIFGKETTVGAIVGGAASTVNSLPGAIFGEQTKLTNFVESATQYNQSPKTPPVLSGSYIQDKYKEKMEKNYQKQLEKQNNNPNNNPNNNQE